MTREEARLSVRLTTDEHRRIFKAARKVARGSRGASAQIREALLSWADAVLAETSDRKRA